MVSGLVEAEIIVNGPDQTSVNIGDDISLNGYVLKNEEVLGLLKFELNCGGSKSVLMIRSISLKTGVKRDFSEEFAILSSGEGSCSVNVVLESGGNVLESKSSSSFTVTKALTGSFSIDKESMQVGESVKVKGTAFRQNGEAVEGFGVVNLKKGGDVYFSDSFDVKKGIVDYVIDTTDVPGGEYDVEVEVREGFGNFIIDEAGKFVLISNIEVNAHSSKVLYLPIEKVRIEGTASVLGGKLKTGKVFVTMGDNFYEEEFRNGNFQLDFYLLNTIVTGKHDITVRVEDEFGNFGEYDFSILVDAIPSTITVVVNKEAISPGDTITIKAFLNDQAGDLVGESLTVKVVNEKGEEYFDAVKNSGEQFDVTLAEDVEPGNYYVKVSRGDVLGEKLFVVGRVLLLDYNIEGQTLVVKNTGNVPYEGVLQIEMRGADRATSISKDVDLGVGQEFVMDLGVGMDSGEYKVSVNGNVFENVQVSGVKKPSYLWLIYVAVVLLLLWLWYYWLKSRKRLNRKIKRTIHKGKVVHPNRKHGEFGGAPIRRVKSDREHVDKFKAYMGRAVSLKKKRRKIRGLGVRKKDRDVYTFFGKKKKEERPEDVSPSDIFSGVGSGWSRGETDKVERYGSSETSNVKKDDKKDEPKAGWFNMFD